MTLEDIHEQKKIEFYSAAVNAWFTTGFEHDKSLLTLSSGGIALLVTLLSTTKVHSIAEMVLYLAALAAFVVCIVSVLFIFKRNGVYLEGLVNGTGPASDSELTKLDNRALLSFGFGVVFALLIGGSAAIESYSRKGNDVAKNETVPLRESFNNAAKLQSDLVQKSANNAAKLIPPEPQASSPNTGKSGSGTSGSGTSNSNAGKSQGGDKK